MTLKGNPKFFGRAAAPNPAWGAYSASPPPKPPAVCTKPLRAFVFLRYARLHQFLGGSTAPAATKRSNKGFRPKKIYKKFVEIQREK